MSRIQEILAKAERDGTARRPSPVPQAAPAPAPVATMAAVTPRPPVEGTSALEPAALPQPEQRVAAATLHPALVAALAPHSAVAEHYRAIRTRLAHREDHGPLRTLIVTSPGAGEGKSVTTANLALTMAQELQSNVVLVDADLRSPAAHSLFGIEGAPGLTEVLAGNASLDEALVYLPDLRLTILPAGNAPQFPTELLGSNAMRRTLDSLRARFDRVLLDAPPVAPLADVGTVAPLTDGAVMVVRAGVTLRPALDQALATFEPGQVVGVVLNEAQ
jgi:capsular exopolysaccharide synthesis family protein